MRYQTKKDYFDPGLNDEGGSYQRGCCYHMSNMEAQLCKRAAASRGFMSEMMLSVNNKNKSSVFGCMKHTGVFNDAELQIIANEENERIFHNMN